MKSNIIASSARKIGNGSDARQIEFKDHSLFTPSWAHRHLTNQPATARTVSPKNVPWITEHAGISR